jgi:hypothetical protein
VRARHKSCLIPPRADLLTLCAKRCFLVHRPLSVSAVHFAFRRVCVQKISEMLGGELTATDSKEVDDEFAKLSEEVRSTPGVWIRSAHCVYPHDVAVFFAHVHPRAACVYSVAFHPLLPAYG